MPSEFIAKSHSVGRCLTVTENVDNTDEIQVIFLFVHGASPFETSGFYY